MFNPFKKKDNSFKLDDISLPSLNDSNNSIPEMPSLEESSLDPTMPELPSLDQSTPSQSPLAELPSLNEPQNNFSTPIPNSNVNPMLNPTPEPVSTSQVNDSMQSEITKAQLETLTSKINLMDARQQNIEQKLEMIYQIILNEVSEDTRRKLNIDSMMSKIRK